MNSPTSSSKFPTGLLFNPARIPEMPMLSWRQFLLASLLRLIFWMAGKDYITSYTLYKGVGILCEPCNGRGWLICDFCKGQKTNVKSENNRIYRRCPNCRAVGYILCAKCKVFKCVTYPDYSDGEL